MTRTPTRSAGMIKPAIGLVLAAIALTAVVVGGLREAHRASDAAAVAAAPAPSKGSATVYYFHGDTRCETCLAIERQTAEAVRSAFAAELADDRLSFQTVNYDLPEHRHFREEYRLSFGSVVVTDGERWENLSEVWMLVHDDDRSAFDAYLTGHIRPFLDPAR